MKITVVGAGFYGSTTVQRIAEANYADELVMVDILEGKPQGLALDMMQSRSIEDFDTRIIGTNSYEETTGSDICVITAGLPRKPGMSRMDLLEVNAKIVSEVTQSLSTASPNAILVVVSNPLDEMTALAAKVSGFAPEKVMGQAGMLDTARFKHNVAEVTGARPQDIVALTLGSHGETMVPVPSQVTVNGKPLADVMNAEEIEAAVQRTRDGGAEIVEFLKTGSAYYAPSAAAAKMVHAIATDAKAEMPVCAFVSGQYGISDVYLGVPAIIGAGGVEKVVELDLASDEREALVAAADAVRAKQADINQFI
ncbi:MAG TPA: malate dehydrogenase [Acidimicrobiia bacterium]|nr:malate dehydrogenase [Acidimicrobiia bacterium]